MVVLLAASAGGHLKELHTLVPRLMPAEPRLWVTFDNPMSRSLLAGEDVEFVPYVHPRDIPHTLSNAAIALRVVRKLRPVAAISTGSGIALAWLPVAAAFGAQAHFIETATRTTGPSICGRLLLPVPKVHVYSQYRSWAGGKVLFGGSVFDGYATEPRPTPELRRVLVTVGSNESYGFERLIRRLLAILPSEVEVRWQVGFSKVPELGEAAEQAIGAEEMVAANRWADVVIGHAGVGTATTALENGKVPVLVPRRKAYDEHIDDHQIQVATELAGRGLAIVAEADELTLTHLEQAAALTVTAQPDLPMFGLAPRP